VKKEITIWGDGTRLREDLLLQNARALTARDWLLNHL